MTVKSSFASTNIYTPSMPSSVPNPHPAPTPSSKQNFQRSRAYTYPRTDAYTTHPNNPESHTPQSHTIPAHKPSSNHLHTTAKTQTQGLSHASARSSTSTLRNLHSTPTRNPSSTKPHATHLTNPTSGGAGSASRLHSDRGRGQRQRGTSGKSTSRSGSAGSARMRGAKNGETGKGEGEDNGEETRGCGRGSSPGPSVFEEWMEAYNKTQHEAVLVAGMEAKGKGKRKRKDTGPKGVSERETWPGFGGTVSVPVQVIAGDGSREKEEQRRMEHRRQLEERRKNEEVRRKEERKKIEERRRMDDRERKRLRDAAKSEVDLSTNRPRGEQQGSTSAGSKGEAWRVYDIAQSWGDVGMGLSMQDGSGKMTGWPATNPTPMSTSKGVQARGRSGSIVRKVLGRLQSSAQPEAQQHRFRDNKNSQSGTGIFHGLSEEVDEQSVGEGASIVVRFLSSKFARVGA